MIPSPRTGPEPASRNLDGIGSPALRLSVSAPMRMMLRIATIRVLIAFGAVCGSAITIQPGQAMPADAQRPENAESARIGKRVAQTHCGGCHAIEATGQSPNPKAPPFPLIAERYPNGNPAPVLIDGTVVRHPGMPEFNLLENETDGLVAYIRRISRQWKPTPGRKGLLRQEGARER